jgi:hypothetical protein
MIMDAWRDLGKAVFAASQLWWWRVAVFVLLPIIMILRWTHAVTGWPFTALNLLYMAAFAGVLIVALARFFRGHNQQGSPWSWHRPVRITREAPPDAGHRSGEQLARLLDEQGRAEVEDLLAAGKPIPAVRRVRELTGLRLTEAKRLADSLQIG